MPACQFTTVADVEDPQLELIRIADRLAKLVEKGRSKEIQEPLDRLQAAVEEIGKSWSGSNIGYHAYVYYQGLRAPPPGRHFSQEWGLMDAISGGSIGEWTEFAPEQVEAEIRARAGHPNLDPAIDLRNDITRQFEESKLDVLSLLEQLPLSGGFLNRLEAELGKLLVPTTRKILNRLLPAGQVISRDMTAMGQGSRIPPHYSLLSEILSVRAAVDTGSKLEGLVRRAGNHIMRSQNHRRGSRLLGDRVFIGHGGSQAWRELKDFIEGRLALPVDEFNRVPIAGITNKERLSEMMDSAAMALLVLTGEDEQSDGGLHPRMNVVHEAGLFQGRLGFERAIILLEDECADFSNIDGLGHIRFPKGEIGAAFEQLRRVFEREGLIEA